MRLRIEAKACEGEGGGDRRPGHPQMGPRALRCRPLAVGSLRFGLQRRYPIWGWPGRLALGGSEPLGIVAFQSPKSGLRPVEKLDSIWTPV